MKLNKLTIENITSIPSAEIDFTTHPLADEKIFLIAGNTGAGKSTIIDCICLALWGNTPRMKAANGEAFKLDDQTGEIRNKDVRQLVRRGAIEAQVTLSFTNNEGELCIAQWECHRSRGRADGKLQDVKRSLTVGNQAPFTKLNDIEREMQRLLGQTEDQFYRTIVLAQGRFAQFLIAKENEKAALLEKMLGTEIYKQIGARIYDTCRTKKQSYEAQQQHLQGVTLLSDDEKAQLEADIVTANQQLEVLTTECEAAKAMLNWVTQKTDNEKQKQQAINQLDELLQQQESDEQQQLQQRATRWRKTVTPRWQLSQQTKAQSNLAVLTRQKTDLQTAYDRLCAAYRAGQAEIVRNQTELQAISQHIQEQESYRRVYESIEEITHVIEKWQSNLKSIIETQQGIEVDQQKLPKAKKAFEDAAQDYQQIDEQLEQLRTQYAALCIPQIEEQYKALNNIKDCVSGMRERHQDYQQIAKDLQNLQTRIEQQKEQLKIAEREEANAQAAANKAREELEMQKDFNALITQARQHVHQGDSCPICGNTIETIIAPKSEDLLRQYQQRYDEANDKYRKAMASHDTAQQMIDNQQADYTEQCSRHEQATSKLNAQWKLLQIAVSQDDAIQLTTMPTMQQSEDLQTQVSHRMTDLEQTMARGHQLNQQINACQETLKAAHTQKQNTEKALNTIENSVQEQRILLQHYENECEGNVQRLNELFGATYNNWKELYNQDNQFISNLCKAAEQFAKAQERQIHLAHRIELQTQALETAKHSMEDAGQSAQITDSQTQNGELLEDLTDQWRQLEQRCGAWSAQFAETRNQIADAESNISNFLLVNSDITREELQELDGYQEAEIVQIETQQRELASAINTLSGQLNVLRDQANQLQVSKPEYAEQDIERLKAVIEQKANLQATQSERLSKLKTQLSTNQQRMADYAKGASRLEEMRKEYEQWDMFCQMLGDATGNKFSKIALSYILHELLATANNYLTQFNNRYTLECAPGTLRILVRDMQYGTTSSTATLSGGEGFMVSLALALALANYANHVGTMDTLFIDEGFDTLSADYLEPVMETLGRLNNMTGRRVGIISHVEFLKERVSTQIRVEPLPNDNTASCIVIVS